MAIRGLSFTSFSAFGLLVLLVGCGGGGEGTGAPAPASACVALGCAANQQVCVEDAKGAHCESCAVGAYAAASGGCEVLGGEPVSHTFSEFTVGPGEEIKGLCQSWTLGNATELWVNAVELVQDAQSHHSNWTFVPSDRFDGPDGVWDCDERNYNQLSGALAGGVLYAQSTQAEHEVQRFPDGVAVRIPPYSRIIGDVHLLNTSSEPASGTVKLTLYGIPEAEVAHKLTPFHLVYLGLAIPPHAKSRFYGHCSINDSYAAAIGGPLDQKLYYILPHTHSMGRRLFVSILGGARDGETIFETFGYNGEARGRVYEQAVDMTGADGYSFGCDFESQRDDVVHYGLGDQEMCELLGFAESGAGFESKVTAAEEVGTDGDVRLFTAPCTTLAFPFDQEKPGGPPPP
jgi:hypothetical protein